MNGLNDGFDQPQPVTDIDLAFPATVQHLMPAMSAIPAAFKSSRGDTDSRSWIDFQSTWFFTGLPKSTQFVPRDGIDPKLALRHLSAVMGSFEPQHEHKTAAVAWLASRWFESVDYGQGASA